MTGQGPSRSELDRALADQLLEERGLPELAHLVVLGLVFLLVLVSVRETQERRVSPWG